MYSYVVVKTRVEKSVGVRVCGSRYTAHRIRPGGEPSVGGDELGAIIPVQWTVTMMAVRMTMMSTTTAAAATRALLGAAGEGLPGSSWSKWSVAIQQAGDHLSLLWL